MIRLTRWCLAIGLLLWATRLLLGASSDTTTGPSLGTILQRAELVVLEAPLESLCIKRREGLVGGVELVLHAKGSALISTD